MNNSLKRAILGSIAASACIGTFVAFTRLTGNPTWVNDQYVVGFPDDHWLQSGPAPGPWPPVVWRTEAMNGLLDWPSAGATSLSVTIHTNDDDPFDHNDGKSTWGWDESLDELTLGVTHVKRSGSQLTETDVLFNPDLSPASEWDILYYPWRKWFGKTDLRSVARHEAGHGIGLDHDETFVAAMNFSSRTGTSLLHTNFDQPGMMPHADDKRGLRTLYPGTGEYRNLYATVFRPNAAGAMRFSLGYNTYSPGGTITVPFYIENQSNVTIPGGPGGIHLGVYLSTDEIITTSDTLIGEIWFASDWAPYAEGLYEAQGTIPITTPLGAYYAGVFIDNQDIVAEAYETDNGLTVPPPGVNPLNPDNIVVVDGKDLWLSELAIDNTTPVRGSNINVSGSVVNNGSLTTPATIVRVWLHRSTPAPIFYTLDEFLLADIPIPTLPGGSSYEFSASVTIPDTLACGREWFVVAKADEDGLIQENTETNNTLGQSLTPQWPSTPGYYIGQTRRRIQRSTQAPYPIFLKQVGTFTPNISYQVFWSCSAMTSPGVPVPPFGTLPLNPDACTDVGIAIAADPNSNFIVNMAGTQTDTPEGTEVTVMGGSWLMDIVGLKTHFAAVYTDAQLNIVGINEQPVSMMVIE